MRKEWMIMKKRLLMLACVLCLGLITTACSEETNDADTKQTASESEGKIEITDEMVVSDIMKKIDLEKCVTLGDYKGIALEKSVMQVTNDDVNNLIQEDLAAYPVDVAGRAAQEGDTVDIDYVGKIDGEEFEGGSDQGALLKLGSGQFIDGFESGLVGASIGETRVLNLTFPEQYTTEELAGKAVEFTVTVNGIKTPLEEPTDEWVAANIEGYYTVREYKDGLRAKQAETNEATAEEQLRYAAWVQVIDGCTVETYPEMLLEYYKNMYIKQSEDYASYYGMSLEEFIESSDMTKEDFDTSAEEYSKEISAQAMICQAICDKEGFAIGDEIYQTKMAVFLEDYGCTEEELLEYNGRDNVEQTILLEMVCDLVLENANIEEVTE